MPRLAIPAVHGPIPTPARRRPANVMNSRTSSGRLRKISTYSAPSRCSQRLGATRNAATSVPSTSAMTKLASTSRVVTQSPEANSSK
jgi:hypothetical protein